MSPRRKQQSESESRTTAQAVCNIVKGTNVLMHFRIKDIKADADHVSLSAALVKMIRETFGNTNIKFPSSVSPVPFKIELTQGIFLHVAVISNDKLQCGTCGTFRKVDDTEYKSEFCPECQGKLISKNVEIKFGEI